MVENVIATWSYARVDSDVSEPVLHFSYSCRGLLHDPEVMSGHGTAACEERYGLRASGEWMMVGRLAAGGGLRTIVE